MLVCSVSVRARRAVAAIIAEAGAAAATVNTLGLGQLVEETTSAADVVNASAVYGAAIVETGGALDTSSATLTVAGVFAVIEAASAADAVNANFITTADVTETATAADASDAAAVAASMWATWDATTVANVTLSGSDLVATNTGAGVDNQGARVADTAVKESGKYYFEDTFTTPVPSGGTPGSNYAIGVGTTASTYPDIGNMATGGAILKFGGNILAAGSYTGINLGTTGFGDVVSVAVDLDNRKIWFRLAGGNWNGNASYDPASNVGGIAIPAGSIVPFATFGTAGTSANSVQTANFGATSFAYTVPSGFAPGWSKFGTWLVSEAAAAADAPDATGGTSAAAGKTAMLAAPHPVFVNSGASREGNVDGIMLNH